MVQNSNKITKLGNMIGNFILKGSEYRHINGMYICSRLQGDNYLLTAVTPIYGRRLWSKVVDRAYIESM